MATYNIIEEQNNHWIKRITVQFDTVIDTVNSNKFSIIVKDRLEHFVGSHIKDNSSFELEELFRNDKYCTLKIDKENYTDYMNADDYSLIKNGIQFWLSDDSKVMYIRIIPKGQSTINPNGYSLFNPYNGDYEISYYVGFDIATFNISVEDEFLCFDCYNLPKVVMGDPIPGVEEYTEPSAWSETPHVLSGNIRTDYDWNDDYKGIDNLYVNNSDSIPVDQKPTPIYIVKSSAYVDYYLVSGDTVDFFESTVGDVVSATRDLILTSGNFDSYLLDELTNNRIDIEYDFTETPISEEDINYVSVEGNTVSSKLYCYEITQTISTSATDGLVKKNQLNLDLEI